MGLIKSLPSPHGRGNDIVGLGARTCYNVGVPILRNAELSISVFVQQYCKITRR